jgi:P4 family phage/plasmid primase-like protien
MCGEFSNNFPRHLVEKMNAFDTIQYCTDNTIPCFSLTIKWDAKKNKKAALYPSNWTEITKPKLRKNSNGLALLTGITFWVLDFDNCIDDLPQEVKEVLLQTCGCIVKTKRGYHFYYKLCEKSEDFRCDSNLVFLNKTWNGVDIRGKGGCIIAPPSTYFDNNNNVFTYEYVKGNLSTIEAAPPQIFMYLQQQQQSKTIVQVAKKSGVQPVGDEWVAVKDAVNMLSPERATNYSDWIAVIWALKNTEDTERSLELAHEFSSRTLKMSQYNPVEVNKIFHSGKPGYTRASLFYWAMKDAPEEYFVRFGMTQLEDHVFRGDSGLAELYALENKHRVVCTCQSISTMEFYIFDENTKLWKESTGNDVKRHFSLTMEGIMLPLHKYYTHKINNAESGEDEKFWAMKRFELAKVMKHTHNNVCAKNVLPYICSAMYDDGFYFKLNKTKHLLSVANGVIDLRCGELLERKAEHYFSYALKTEYHPERGTGKWGVYFSQVFQRDQEVIDWLQSYLGYTLTGETNLRRFVVMWGSGSNSKSVLLNFLAQLMEEKLYATLSFDDIRAKDGGSRDCLYDARDARAAVIIETSAFAKFDEEILKGGSGEDALSVSKKYKSQITFYPQFKLFICSNNKPHFDSSKQAVWDRVILLPFEVAFKEKDSPEWDDDLAAAGKMYERDQNFLKELRGDIGGFLNWCVEGAVRFYNAPERIPSKLRNAAKDYKKSCNPYYKWLQENYEKTGSEEDFVTSEQLIGEWKNDNPRCRDNDKAVAMKLSAAVKEWGIDKGKRRVDGININVYLHLRKQVED